MGEGPRSYMHGRPAAGEQVNCYGLSAQQLNHHYATISTDAHSTEAYSS